jgi:hypothetical protein
MPVVVVVVQHQVKLVVLVVLVVVEADGPQGQEELLMQQALVELVYQHRQQTIDNKKVLMELVDLVVEEVALVTLHLKEEMVVLVS